MGTSPPRLSWPPIIERAREIVRATEIAITLRYLFYALVSEELIPNTRSPYKRLSALTAKGRREGTFPRLIDPTRGVSRMRSWDGIAEGIEWFVKNAFALDRTAGQSVLPFLVVEKATQKPFLEAWFGHLGVPIVALRGFASESLVEEVVAAAEDEERPTVAIYAGTSTPPAGTSLGTSSSAPPASLTTSSRSP